MATKKNPRMNQLGNISSIPYPIPATVKALGEPEEIFPPSTQRSSLGTLIGSLLAITAVLLFAIGAMLLYCAVHPFGTNPPPAAVCWGAGTGLTLLGFAALFGSYYYLSGRGDNKQAYLIFPHCLIEIRPAQHRFIAWESTRQIRRTSKETTGE